MRQELGEAEINDKKIIFIDNPFLSASIKELKNFFVNGEIDGHRIEGIEYYAKACPPYETLGLLIKKDDKEL